uniref:Translation initiation factor IF-2-like n=1 Tax=Taeniopygia guttata TaxID=59729 RepID=A0A674H5J0_TAEGU
MARVQGHSPHSPMQTKHGRSHRVPSGHTTAPASWTALAQGSRAPQTPGAPEALLPPALLSPHPHHLPVTSPAGPVTALRACCPLAQTVPECAPQDSAVPGVPSPRVSPLPVPAALSLPPAVPRSSRSITPSCHPGIAGTPLRPPPCPEPSSRGSQRFYSHSPVSAVSLTQGSAPRPRCRQSPHPGSRPPGPRCPQSARSRRRVAAVTLPRRPRCDTHRRRRHHWPHVPPQPGRAGMTPRAGGAAPPPLPRGRRRRRHRGPRAGLPSRSPPHPRHRAVTAPRCPRCGVPPRFGSRGRPGRAGVGGERARSCRRPLGAPAVARGCSGPAGPWARSRCCCRCCCPGPPAGPRLDLSNCSLHSVPPGLAEATTAMVLDLTENPLTALPSGSFLGFIHLQSLAVPLTLQCPGGRDAWQNVTVDRSSRLCQGQRNPCNSSVELAWPCPENSVCAPDGPGLIQCLCDSPFHGYKCLREGPFPMLLFGGILGTVTVSLSLLLWGTQRRKAKTP